MQCGCPLPDDTIGQRLRRILSPRKNARVSKPEADSVASAETHPSDHNAVHVIGIGASQPKTKRKSKNSTHEQAFRPVSGVSAVNAGGCVSDSHHTVDKVHGSTCVVVCNID